MRKALILGGNGLLGKQLQRDSSGTTASVVATYNASNADRNLVCNILDREQLAQVFEQTQPDVVINAANLAGGVDFCENNPEIGRAFHLDATIQIARLCERYNARLAFISTDYVFDGKNPPYSEEDTP